jgi:3'-phosphoadenosine 5'-phosphosulfate sulfotransferase (PAPS reductase)/FAD synthetase
VNPQAGDVIAVWFSCGAASAVAAKKTLERYGKECVVRVINNPVKEEHEDNQRFLRDVEKWLGVKIESVVNPKWPNASAYEIWDKGFMASRFGAVCTLELKKKARQHWEKENRVDWHVLGFTAEEKGRYDRFALTERPNTLPVLIDAGISKKNCFELLTAAGIRLPEIYFLGYPNANCIGCVKATSPTYWNHVRKMHPQVFAERAEQSRRIGAKLARYKGQRLYLDELPQNAKGGDMKKMSFECGLFCEER